MQRVRKSAKTKPDNLASGFRLSLTDALSAGNLTVACRLMSRAEAMGVVDISAARFDESLLRQALVGFADVGIGRRALVYADSLDADLVDAELHRWLESFSQEVEETPSPTTEWDSMVAMFGNDVLAALVGVSSSSVARYHSGARSTPDLVAQRLHFVALIVADLLGAYNSFGVRRWFDRPRTALYGQAPSELLAGDWSPSDDGPLRVARLAASLVTMTAT